MNAIMPAAATLMAASVAAMVNINGMYNRVRIPKVWALTSPSSSMLSMFPINGDMIRVVAAMVLHRVVVAGVVLPNPPIDHVIMLLICSLVEMLRSRVVMALATKLNIMPESSILLVDVEGDVVFFLIGLTASIDTSAPIMANIVMPFPARMPESPKLMHIATPRSAPPDVPSVYGSTSGFLNIVCIIMPDAPSMAPMASAANVRGSLICVRIMYSTLSAGSSDQERMLDNDNPFSPTHSDATVEVMQSNVSVIREMVLRMMSFCYCFVHRL